MRIDTQTSKAVKNILVVIALMASAVAAAPVAEPSALTAAVEQGEVDRLIQALSDPAYDRRTFATRRLAAIGMEAYEPLRKAAAGPDLEAALRAQRILDIIQSIYFAGCRITLSFNKETAAWDEAVDLKVTIENKSLHPAQAPLEAPAGENDKRSAEAAQVAHMLDVAEWLTVFGPDGKAVELRVDEIAADAQVTAVVQARLDVGPVTTIPAGEQTVITIKDFNRGWARYALLERGEYTAVLEYLPPWTDPAMAEAKVGRARSNMASLIVSRAAPPEVSRSGAEASISLVREGEALSARLTNHSDLPLLLNLNLGISPPFAQAQWVVQADERAVELPASPAIQDPLADFHADRIVEVPSGRSIEVARMPIDDLRRQVSEKARAFDWANASVRFYYANLCNRAWQLRHNVGLPKDPKLPKVLREPLPRRLLSLHQTSGTLDAADLR